MILSTTQPQDYMHNNDYENSLKRIEEESVVVGNRISEVNVSSVGVGTHSFSPNNVRNVPPVGSSASGWCTECVRVVNSGVPSSIPNDKKNVSFVKNNVTNDVSYNANTSSIEDYNCSVDFVASPFLVRESTFKGKNGSFETLRLDLMDHTTTSEDYYQEGNHVHPRLKALDAYMRALTTWAKWVDRKVNANHTQVFFRGYSVTHFWGGQWNSGGQCHKETEPIYNETYLQKYPSKMRALDHVMQNMKTKVVYMNISRLTDYRKDGHPSVYRKDYKTAMKQNLSSLYEDCSHWCLPGVPDTWNELLYVSLLKYGKGAWKT
ncbi:hypothetical protein TSUD_190530 [Trifolium subterraneum]|uniref:Trichome birefringence-like C-terminal domain-containing protein n=1 Tax=Trifolium subterraneum TaxID=3900 RepID=A0A2Z6NGR0_TRISU|nr:hypothetical protein TSUD_190530 [Trifolium subterraneum]